MRFHLLATLLGLDFIAFALFGLDKALARLGLWRLSESFLLACCGVGGPGAGLGIFCWRHKSAKPGFMGPAVVWIVLSTVLQGLIVFRI